LRTRRHYRRAILCISPNCSTPSWWPSAYLLRAYQSADGPIRIVLASPVTGRGGTSNAPNCTDGRILVDKTTLSLGMRPHALAYNWRCGELSTGLGRSWHRAPPMELRQRIVADAGSLVASLRMAFNFSISLEINIGDVT
jgi:hypothetical protein